MRGRGTGAGWRSGEGVHGRKRFKQAPQQRAEERERLDACSACPRDRPSASPHAAQLPRTTPTQERANAPAAHFEHLRRFHLYRFASLRLHSGTLSAPAAPPPDPEPSGIDLARGGARILTWECQRSFLPEPLRPLSRPKELRPSNPERPGGKYSASFQARLRSQACTPTEVKRQLHRPGSGPRWESSLSRAAMTRSSQPTRSARSASVSPEPSGGSRSGAKAILLICAIASERTRST